MSNLSASVDDLSERQNLMTGRVQNSISQKRRPVKPFGKQELSVVPQQRNWKGIFLSILVIAIVCVLIGLSAWLLQPPENTRTYKYVYDFDAIFDATWRPYATSGRWIGDLLVYRDRHQNVVKRTGDEVEILISNETILGLEINKASVSPDLKYALLSYGTEKVFRHSTVARYLVYDIDNGTHKNLHDGPLQYAEWGARGNQLTYVTDSDLYYQTDVQATPERITTTGEGSEGNIMNGIADWVYEEEMFSSTVAHWMSAGGSYVAYVAFNDTLVPQVDIVLYNVPYPQVEKINYPKAGYENPVVDLFVRDLKAKKELKVSVPRSLRSKEPLLNSFVWTSDTTALVTWSNRYQNTSVVALCSVPLDFEFWDENLTCKEIREQREDGWIEHVSSPPVPGPAGVLFRIEEKAQGGKGKFHHLMMVEYKSEPVVTRFLTSGNWEVTAVVGYHAKMNRVYFISTEQSPMDRHLYSVEVVEQSQPPFCHTCETACRYVQARMSPSAPWVLISCKGPGVPYDALLNLENEERVMIENNKELQEKMRDAKVPEVLLDTVRIRGENGDYDFQAKVFLPPNAQLKKDIPLLVDLYAGPGSQKVDARFLLDWTTYLVTNKDIAVLTFDGRGSGFRGSNVMKEVNRRLGRYEVEDQITAIKEVTAKYPYLSETKIGVWGWSYGGYASAMLATHPWSRESNLTKCAISVAPVTEWRLYDSVYTEKYMGSPNLNSYVESSLLPRARHFENFKYLLVHGTRDDNVHFQNSAVLETELVRAGVVHRYQVYTDETHSLSREPTSTQRHLYKLMTQFLMECFQTT